MSQWWNEKQEAEAITLVDCNNVEITNIRTSDKDGYKAVALGIKKAKGDKKAPEYKIVKEFRVEETDGLENNQLVKVDLFKAGDTIKVTGMSKGKGFQGVVKRHGFSGGPKTHGHRHVLRSGGSIGSAFPQHVMKGKKMAGRMGNEQVTVRNLEIAWTDADKNLIAVRGAIPGRKGSWIKIVEG